MTDNTKIVLISTGEYSGYSVVCIARVPRDMDVREVYKKYHAEQFPPPPFAITPPPDDRRQQSVRDYWGRYWRYEHDRNRELARLWGMPLDERFSPDEEQLFGWWLRHQGYEVYEYEEVNLSDISTSSTLSEESEDDEQ